MVELSLSQKSQQQQKKSKRKKNDRIVMKNGGEKEEVERYQTELQRHDSSQTLYS